MKADLILLLTTLFCHPGAPAKPVAPIVARHARVLAVDTRRDTLKIKIGRRDARELDLKRDGVVLMKAGVVVTAASIKAGDSMMGISLGRSTDNVSALCDTLSYAGFFRRTVWAGHITSLSSANLTASVVEFPLMANSTPFQHSFPTDKHTIYLISGKVTTFDDAAKYFKTDSPVYVASSRITADGRAVGRQVIFDAASIREYMRLQSGRGSVHLVPINLATD